MSAPQRFSSLPHFYRFLSKLILGCVRTSALFIAAPFESFSQQTHFGLCPHLSAFHRGPISTVFSANSFWAVSAPQRFSSLPHFYRFLSKLILGCVRTSALSIAAPFVSFSQQTHFGLCPRLGAFHRGPCCFVFAANSLWAVSAPQRFSSRPQLYRFPQQTHFGLCPHLGAVHRGPSCSVFSANSFWAVSAPQRFSSRPHLNRFLSKLILGCVRASALFIAAPFVSFSQQTHFATFAWHRFVADHTVPVALDADPRLSKVFMLASILQVNSQTLLRISLLMKESQSREAHD